jgi:hypothetical protein
MDAGRPDFQPSSWPGVDASGDLSEFAGAGEAVADARHGQDEERVRRVLLDLSAQVADVETSITRVSIGYS